MNNAQKKKLIHPNSRKNTYKLNHYTSLEAYGSELKAMVVGQLSKMENTKQVANETPPLMQLKHQTDEKTMGPPVHCCCHDCCCHCPNHANFSPILAKMKSISCLSNLDEPFNNNKIFKVQYDTPESDRTNP